jgi:hypothetical protein
LIALSKAQFAADQIVKTIDEQSLFDVESTDKWTEEDLHDTRKLMMHYMKWDTEIAYLNDIRNIP